MMAEDATKVAPHVYKVLFENERARVLEVSIQPGERSEMHSHPDYFVYFLSDGKGKFTTPSGETDEIEMPAAASMLGAPPSARSSSSPSSGVAAARGDLGLSG